MSFRSPRSQSEDRLTHKGIPLLAKPTRLSYIAMTSYRVLFTAVLIWPTIAHAQTPELDPLLSEYKPVSGIAGGSLKFAGSNTMANILSLWSEDFRRFYPGIRFEIDGKGSAIAIPSLIEGQSAFGLMSRPPTKVEQSNFKIRHGYEVVTLEIGIDTVAFFVNKQNPLEGLAFPEIDAIFSSTRIRGAKRRAELWRDFLPSEEWQSQPVTCYGRNSASGTYGFVRQFVLKNGDYGNWVSEESGSAAVVNGVSKSRGGIGYGGIGYKTNDVKALKICERRGGELVEPTFQNAYSGKYPLSRFLYLAINFDSRTQLDPHRREFIRYVLSRQGQERVREAGFLPINQRITERVLARLSAKD